MKSNMFGTVARLTGDDPRLTVVEQIGFGTTWGDERASNNKRKGCESYPQPFRNW